MALIPTKEVVELLKQIEALANNPHWTADRRWTIAAKAKQARKLIEENK